MPEYRKILAATDLSETSIGAVDRAADLAKKLGASLTLLYVVTDRIPPMVLAVAGVSMDVLLEQHLRRAQRSLGEFAAERFPGGGVATRVVAGTPSHAILEVAREGGFDLVVVGTHGHGLLGHTLLGSTAERVLHHAPCPVLVVGPPAKP